MEKKKYILYPGQVLTGDTNFPNGKAVDVSSPGAADGTPWKEDLINERFGFEDISGLPWIEIDFPDDIERATHEILQKISDIN